MLENPEQNDESSEELVEDEVEPVENEEQGAERQ
jgi:hypothetical protein